MMFRLAGLSLWRLEFDLERLETLVGLASAFIALFVIFQWFMDAAAVIAVYSVVVAAALALARNQSKRRVVALQAAIDNGVAGAVDPLFRRRNIVYALLRLLCMSAIAVTLVAGLLSRLPGLRH